MKNASQHTVCPLFDDKFPSHPLNPKYCCVGGRCNYCDYYIKKECKGCSVNMEVVSNSNNENNLETQKE